MNQQRHPRTPGWELWLALGVILIGTYFVAQIGIWMWVGGIAVILLFRDNLPPAQAPPPAAGTTAAG